VRPPGPALALGLLLFALSAPGCGGDDESDSNTTPSAGADAAEFSTNVDHPLVPLSSVRRTVFEGRERDRDTGKTIETRVEQRVLDETRRVAGVPVAVVAVKEYEDGELVESTRDYFAQRADGSVWYMGEHVDDYENGKLVGHGGQWIAGKDNAKAGLFMPAEPKVGQAFEQERAPGVAEDRSRVIAVGLKVSTRAGNFDDCIRTRDYAPLDKSVEFKIYCAEVGLVREEGRTKRGRLDLVSYR
jgi:hypothetical protein